MATRETAFTLPGMETPEEIRARIGRAGAQEASAFGLQFANNAGYKEPRNRVASQIGASFGQGLASGVVNQRAAQASIDRAQAAQELLSNVDWTDPDSLTQGARNAALSGFNPLAMEMGKRASDLRKNEFDPRKHLSGKSQIFHMASNPDYWGEDISSLAVQDLQGGSENARELFDLQSRIRDIDLQLVDKPDDPVLLRERKQNMDRVDKLTTITGTTEHDPRIKANKLDELIGERQYFERMRAEIQHTFSALQQSPALAGMLGSFNRGAQFVGGSVTDLLSVIGNAAETSGFSANIRSMLRNEDEETQNLFSDLWNPDIPRIRQFEIELSYAIARMNKGGGRMNVEDRLYGERMSKITGLTSSFDVLQRLKGIDRRFNQHVADLSTRIGDGYQPAPLSSIFDSNQNSAPQSTSFKHPGYEPPLPEGVSKGDLRWDSVTNRWAYKKGDTWYTHSRETNQWEALN